MRSTLIGILLSLSTIICWSQTNTAISSGTWESGSNWSLGHAPVSTENVVVPSPYSLSVNINDVCLSLTINNGGTVTIVGPQNLSIAGSFTNAGIFTATDPGSSLTFNAGSNSLVSGAGSYTIAGTIVLDMGAITTSLDIQSSSFCGALTGSFTLTQGTWIMDNGGLIDNLYTNTPSQLIIPNTVVIQSNLGRMNLGNNATSGNVLLEGELFVNGGVVSVACSQGYNAGIDFQYKVVGGISPILKMTGGSLFIFAGFNANSGSDYINFNMSGGILYTAFSIGNTNGGWSYNHTFQLQDVLGGQTVMTGGAIVLQDACDAFCYDLDMGGANVAATLYSVTGGTIQLGYTNTQPGASWFAIEPEPATNYPFLDFESGAAKIASPWTGNNLNFMSMNINANMTFDCTQFNNNVTFENENVFGPYALNIQGTLNSGSGTFAFDGNIAQIISGSAAVTIDNLLINNSSASGVTLQTPINIPGSLTLTNGLLNTTATDIVTLSAGATSSPGSTTSYVNGPMAKTGNTAFTFPIGGSNRFMPLGISAPATITNTITTKYTHTAPVNPASFNVPLTGISSVEWWNISETVPTDAVKITLNWQNGPSSGISNYNFTLHVADYTGVAWNDLGEGGVTGVYPGAGSVTAVSTITGFNNLPITFGFANTNPLPITLTSFTANYIEENNSVLTNWTVATQLNNKEFIVEKTVDGTNYREVATVAGAGTTPFTISYSAIDLNPTTGYSYYRLKQIDIDGNLTVFSPIPIFIQNTTGNSSISLYPNPVNSIATLNYNSTDENNLPFDIIDASGRTVSSFVINNIHQGENNYALNTDGLSPGVYFLRAAGSQKLPVLRFIKVQ